MIGIILISIGTFFEEIYSVIGKNKASNHEESPYTMVFLSLFFTAVFFGLIALINQNLFVFSSASIPTFSLSIILETLQWYLYVFAIIEADRTTFSFVRVITIPLLLLVDISLGYFVSIIHIIGIFIITFAIFIAFANGGLKRKGLGFVLFSALNAVLTTSIYKYNITHFNSVVAEKLCGAFILACIFFALAMIKTKENPLKFLTKPSFFIQSLTIGISELIQSFAYSYGTASVIVTVKRAFGVFWSILSGKTYFKEKHIIFKFGISLLIIIGLICLAQQ